MNKPDSKPNARADTLDGSTQGEAEPAVELPRHRHVYSPPKPAASLVSHETLDMRSVRLAPEIDPRRAPTMLSLRPVQIVVRPMTQAPKQQFVSLSGALLLVSLAVLPGTVVWWVRTHGLLDATPDLARPAYAGSPSGEPESAAQPVRPGLDPQSLPIPESSQRSKSTTHLPEAAAAPSRSAAPPVLSAASIAKRNASDAGIATFRWR